MTTPTNNVPNGLVGWYLSQLEDISGKLHQTMTEPTRFNDFDKAQLFLGYLAAFPKREKAENLPDTGVNNNTEEVDGNEQRN